MPELALEHSAQTDLYRIDLYRRLSDGETPPVAKIPTLRVASALKPESARFMVWGARRLAAPISRRAKS
jgi:hypothetical protein